MIYALGGISGGHFNPAVSLAVLIAKSDFSATSAGIYMACQIAGGVCAGGTYGLVLWDVFNLAPTPGFGLVQAGVAELIYTFMLCFVVLNVACSKDGGNQYYGLAIGFCVVAGGYGGGHISGGCFNPAVALGIDISSAGLGFGWSLVYVVFEFLGACAAALVFKTIRAHEQEGSDGVASLGSKLISEFLGTYMLVLTVGLNVIGGSKAPVLSIAASLMCMIYALGSVSGANFNPAVSLCLLCTNRPAVLKPADGGAYIGVQLVAGILAGFTYMALENGKTFPLAPGKNFTLGQAGFSEIVFTFLLCYVVCCTATIADGPLTQYFGLAIGSCVTAGGYAIGAVSGGSLNPAVSFGIVVSHMANGGNLMNALYYTVFEFIGAVIAAGLFLFTHATDSSLAKKEVESAA
jgi:aquaporin Z